MIFSSFLIPSRPCAATMPSSAKCARMALITWVRCRIKRSRAMQHQPALLLGRFDLYETHGRPPRRLADRLGVGRIVLVALDVGLHVPRRHQPHPVAKFREFTRPIMSRGAGFHADKASRQRLEELQHLAAPQLLTNDDLFSRVDAMDLEHVLGDIQTDRCNLHWDRSLM